MNMLNENYNDRLPKGAGFFIAPVIKHVNQAA